MKASEEFENVGNYKEGIRYLINGQDSEYPYPLFDIKIQGTYFKEVEVTEYSYDDEYHEYTFSFKWLGTEIILKDDHLIKLNSEATANKCTKTEINRLSQEIHSMEQQQVLLRIAIPNLKKQLEELVSK